MELRITTLSENTAIMGSYLAEWGLSILVETVLLAQEFGDSFFFNNTGTQIKLP